MSLKSSIVPTLHWMGLVSGFSTRRAQAVKGARILKLHGVGADEYSAAMFETQLKFLIKNFSVVKLGEILELKKKEVSSGRIVLTFDDGLRNNFTNAYPILRRLKVPATFFVCPGLVENSRWLWTHETRARLAFLGLKQREFFSRWKQPLNANVSSFVDWMKQLPSKSRGEVEDNLRNESSGFIPSAKQRNDFDLMNWDELCSLDPDLITIGSHSVNHPILTSLTPDESTFEISQSQKMLEAKLGRAVDFFCYPNGSCNARVIEETRKYYRAAVSTQVGFVTSTSDLHSLPRIGITPQLSLLAWRLHRPTA